MNKIQQTWLELQVDLATLSTRSEHIVVTGSSHTFQLDKPKAVVHAILKASNSIIGFMNQY